MGTPDDAAARARASRRDRAPRHRDDARRARRVLTPAGAGALAVGGLVLLLGVIGAVFSSTTAGPSSTLTAASLNDHLPTAVTATRTGATTCQVSWTPDSGLPAGLTYDITDGTSTVVTAATGTTAAATVPAATVTPTVRVRLGTWVSSSATAAATVCAGWPDAPTGLTLTPSDAAVSATWTAPAANGGTIASYTATISPAPGSGSATCTATAPTTSCSWSALTNGLTYTVSVTATSQHGTGPAATATAVPYPSTVMSPANLALWLDGADSSTLYAGSTCTGAAATSSVGCWKDKSTNANHMTQSTAASQPATTTVAGRIVPLFDGTSDLLSGDVTRLPTGTASTTVFVGGSVDPSVAMNGISVIAWGGTTSGSQRRVTSWAATGVDAGTTPQAFTSAWAASGAQSVAVGEFASGTSMTVWSRGEPGATTAGAWTTGTDHVWIGSGGLSTPSGRWMGTTTEIVVLSGTVTASQRRQVEEYLARKWGSVLTPGAPTDVTPSAGDGQADVSWTAPWNGGSTITGYTVTAVPSDGSLSTRTASCTGSPCAVTGLTNGATYTVTVTATNAVGAGPASTATTVVPRPALLVSSDAALWLDGKDVDGDGLLEGSGEACDTATTCTAASNVLTRWQDKSGNDRDAVQSTTAMAGTYVPATGLVTFTGNGYYQAANVPTGPGVTAFTAASAAGTTFNAYGWLVGSRAADGWVLHPEVGSTGLKFFGITSSGYNAQTTNTAVVAPTTALTSAHVWDGRISGGTASQTLNVAVDGAVSATASSTSTRGAANVTLTVGADDYDLAGRRGQGSYREVVVFEAALTDAQRRAVQEYLARKWSVVVTPSAPTAVTATPSTTADGTASVAWSAPAWDGGAAVTGHTLTATPADGTLATVTTSCASSPCTVSGLVDGASYTVSVAATNSAGTGPAGTAAATLVTYPATVMTAARTKLWLDGADASTVLASSTCTGATATSTVGCWKDRSASANHVAQATSTSQPGLGTVAGRSVPLFDGTSDYLEGDVALVPTGTATSTVLAAGAVDPSIAMNGVAIVSWGGTTSGTQRRVTSWSATGVDAWTTPQAFATAWAGSSAQSVAVGEFAAGTSVSVWGRGDAGATASGAYTTGTHHLWVGSGGTTTPSARWKGTASEIVVLDTTLTRAERRKAEEYLARKWGGVIAPDVPTAVTAAASTTTNGAADVAWTAPSGWNGGSAISGYTVRAAPADGTAATVTTTCTSSPCTVTGLTNGALYTVTVAAVNGAGTGTAVTASSTVTPYPAALFAASTLSLWMDGADAATLLTSSTCTGGTASSGTAIGCWKDKSAQANDAAQTTSGLRATVGSLNSRTAPAFDGTDDYYPLTVAKLPTGTTPSAIYSVAVQEDTAPAATCWRHLVGWGGAGTTGATRVVEKGCNNANAYVETYNTWSSVPSTLTWPTSAAAIVDGVVTSSTLRSDVNGARSYSISVTNSTGTASGAALGTAPWSTSQVWKGRIAEVVVLNSDTSTANHRIVQEYLARKWNVAITPSAPSAVAVSGGDTQATVTWTAPWNGYSTITGYTVTATPQDGSLSTRTASCASSGCTVTGLTNGATYAFTVTATNALGTGPASAAVNASAYPVSLFTAADLRVWLDAQHDTSLSAATDCSGSSAATGAVVGCWKDRSGNGWNAPVPSGASGATLTASAVNGRQALRFTRTTPNMYQVSAAGIGAVGGADRSVFAVAAGRTTNSTAGTGNAGVVAAFNTNWTSGLMVRAYSGTTTVNYVQGDAYDTVATGLYSGASASTSPFVAAQVASSSGGTLTNAFALNGRGAPGTASTTGTWMTYGDSFSLGSVYTNAAQDYAYPLDGDVGEVLVFDRALSASERRTVEEYLARHWAVTIAPAAPATAAAAGGGTTSSSVSWTAPAWNGGASVTSYTATATASGQTTRTCTSAGTSCTVTGLTDNVTYTVTVTATNSVGAGPGRATTVTP